jgi:3'-phosphoadenosine 5'-phosphosulfate sulfotransferase (PAPS reductase)/FAD synthetase
MTHVVQFSGGKDSTALVLWARENLPEFKTVFCDTGWEHPLTMTYIDYINETLLDGKLIVVRSEKYPTGMIELVHKRKIVPSVRMRFCTEELKVFPFIKFMKEIDDECTVYQGIRGDESLSRLRGGARMWEPAYEAWIERPLFDWSAARVFGMMQKHGIEPNPLYKLGASRVGCFPCVMVNKGELRRCGQTLPEIWDRAQALEDAVADGRSFFRCDYIPERFQTGVYTKENKDGEKLSHPTVADVRRYIEDADKDQLRMWNACADSGCMSVYNLCE